MLNRRKLLLFITVFCLVSSFAKGAYWGVTYREFGVNDDSVKLTGGKTYTMLPYYGVGVGLGGYFTLNKIDANTDCACYKDEIYIDFAGIYILKKIYIGGIFDVTLVPNIFFGSGNISIDRKNTYTESSILKEESDFNLTEPGLIIEFSLSENIKIETGISYATISKTKLSNYNSDDFEGMTISFSIVIGSSPYDYGSFGNNFFGSGSSAVESSKHKN